MKKSRPTGADVARLAGVSTATVSFAFRRPNEVRPETRDAVYAAAEELGYIPNTAARALARGGTGVLGIQSFDLFTDRPVARPALSDEPVEMDVAPDALAFPLYVDEIQRGFELECRGTGRSVLVTHGARTAQEVNDSLGRVDGLAVFPIHAASASVPAALSKAAETVPIVLFSAPTQGPDPFFRVLAQNAAGMRGLLEHLTGSHAVRSAAFVGSLAVADYAQRWEVVAQTLGAAAGERPWLEPVNAGDLPESLPLPSTLPDAIVCASDQLALALMERLAAAGVSVPGDVIVTGFDGVLAGRVSTPSLTTVRQPMEAMGRVAARLLIEEQNKPTLQPRSLSLPTSLLLGGSCGCAAPAA